MDCSPLGSSVHGILQAGILEWITISSPGDLSNPRIKPRSPALQVDSLPTELPGKLKNTGVVDYPFSRDLTDPGIKLGSPESQVDSLPAELPRKP